MPRGIYFGLSPFHSNCCKRSFSLGSPKPPKNEKNHPARTKTILVNGSRCWVPKNWNYEWLAKVPKPIYPI